MKPLSYYLTGLFLIVFLQFFNTQMVNAQGCVTPADVQATAVTANGMTVNWSPDSNADRYRVRYRISGTRRWSSLATTSNSVELSGLAENTSYQIRVRAICGRSRSSWSSSIFVSTSANNPTCEVPQGLFTLGIGSLQATLTWQAVTGADFYQARIRAVGLTEWTLISDVVSNLVIAEGLQANTTYEYQVQANCAQSNSAFSESETFTTVDNVCIPPLNFQTITVTANSATLSWDAVGGANHYLVRYREVGSTTWLLRDFIGSTSVTLIDLFPDTSFEAQVQADCTLGSTDFTESIFFTTAQIDACEQPQNLSATQVSETFATHNWDAVVGALDYTMRRRVSGTTTWTFESTTAETSLQTFLLTPATTYEFQVEARCSIGNSGFTASFFYTTAEIADCPTPENLTNTDITDSSVLLNWEDFIEAQTFTVDHRVVGSLTWTSQNRNFSNLSLAGLQPSTNYEWRVRSNCESINSQFSEIASFTTLSAGSCPVPAGLFVLGITGSGATLTWQTASGAQNYQVRYRASGSANWINQGPVSSNLLVVSGLAGSTTYEFQVQSNCSNGPSAFSTSFSFMTLTSSGAAISNVGITNNHQLLVYPNPFINQVNIVLTGTAGETQEVTIYNHRGTPVVHRSVRLTSDAFKLTISLENKSLGLYHITIATPKGVTNRRLIRQ